MTKNQLKKLRKELPRGTYEKLANEFGYSKCYIISILFGQRPKSIVIERAINIAEDIKALEKTQIERINNLTNENQLEIKFKR